MERTLRPAPVCGLWVVTSLLVVLPVLATRYPPLVDYPNHLARCYILHRLADDPTLRHYYRNVMAAQPNLAMDLVVPLLERLVSIWNAGRIFVAASLLLPAWGCLLLHHALHRRWSAWPALAFLFVYNRLLLWGFLGYLFGLGAALASAAGWIFVQARDWRLRLGYGWVVTTIIYLLHLYALGIYGVLVGGFLLADWADARRTFGERAGQLLVLAGGFAPAIILFLFVSPTSAAARRFVWGGLLRKLTEPFKFMVGIQPRLDVLGSVAVAGVVLILLLRRQIGLARACVPALLGLAVLLLPMPNELFSSFGADRRIPIAFVLVGIAATDWRQASPRLRATVMSGAAVLLVLQVGATTTAWAGSQPVYRDMIALFERLPVGARLLAAVPAVTPAFPPLYHVDAYAVIMRDAFVPSLFAAPEDAGSSLGFTPAYQGLRLRTPPVVIWPGRLAQLADQHFARRHGPFRTGLIRDYNAALVLDPAAIPVPARLSARCRLMAQGPGFELARLPCR